MRILGWILAPLIVICAAQASAQGPRFGYEGCDPRVCSESDWIPDDNKTNHVTVWRHDLGATPRAISLLFSPDLSRGRVYPKVWSWHDPKAGNPVSIDMNRRTVRLFIHTSGPLHGVWRPEHNWKLFREGYWKIIVYR